MLTNMALCERQDCQSWQFIRGKSEGEDDPFWMWYRVTLFVRLYGNWLWRQQKIIVVGVTLPGRTDCRCQWTVVVYFTCCEVMSGYHLCIPRTDRPVNHFDGHGTDFSGQKPTLPAAKWLRVAKKGHRVVEPANANSGLMHQNVPVTAVCLFSYRTPITRHSDCIR